MGILSRIRRFISQKTAINIYKCMIRPHLDYIDFVVDSGAYDRIKKLDRLQDKAITVSGELNIASREMFVKR